MTGYIFTPDDEIECPECLGFGEVEYDFEVIDHLRGGEIVSRVLECRVCEGSGVAYVIGGAADDEEEAENDN